MNCFSLVSLFLLTLGGFASHTAQGDSASIIEGTVYDRNGAIIQNVSISLQETKAHVVSYLKTDDNGHYKTAIKPGRYSLTLNPSPGFPIPYEHSSFDIPAGGRIVINFRPRFVYSISDSIQGGNWVEKYETDGHLPSTTVHYVQESRGAIRDLRIQYLSAHTRSDHLEYATSVTASFGCFTVYAEQVFVYLKKNQLVAERDVLFEDGRSVHRGKRLEIDLHTGLASLDGAHVGACAR